MQINVLSAMIWKEIESAIWKSRTKIEMIQAFLSDCCVDLKN